jgi:peptide/nickel transport system substrate-binding protein
LQVRLLPGTPYLINLRTPGRSVESIRVNLADLAGSRVIDDLTVEITTKSPNLFFPRLISELKIVEPSQWALGRDAFAQSPIGTGPFEVTAFSANGIKLKASPTSWRAPKAMGLEIQSIPDGVSRVQALLSGKTDIALLLGPEDIEPIEAADNRMLIYPTGGVFVVGFITEQTKTAVHDIRLRQALNYDVDKDAIVNRLLAGHSRPASQLAPQVAFGFDETIAPYPHDPARARKLLADAGYMLNITIGCAPTCLW